MIRYYPDLQRHSPLRPLDWRWRRAQWLVTHNRNFSRRRDDIETGRAVHYLRALACSPNGADSAELQRRYPDVYAAHRLHEAGGVTTLLVQARLLAGQSSAQ